MPSPADRDEVLKRMENYKIQKDYGTKTRVPGENYRITPSMRGTTVLRPEGLSGEDYGVSDYADKPEAGRAVTAKQLEEQHSSFSLDDLHRTEVKRRTIDFDNAKQEVKQWVSPEKVYAGFGQCQVSCESLYSDFGKMSLADIDSLTSKLMREAKNVAKTDPEKAAADLATVDCSNMWLQKCEEEIGVSNALITNAGCADCDIVLQTFHKGMPADRIPLRKSDRQAIISGAVAKLDDRDLPREKALDAFTTLKCLITYEDCLTPGVIGEKKRDSAMAMDSHRGVTRGRKYE
jgi:hypothetical protein